MKHLAGRLLGGFTIATLLLSPPALRSETGRRALPALRAEAQRPADDAVRDHLEAVRAAYSGARAREVVAFVEQFWRVPGNTGFDASIMRVITVTRFSSAACRWTKMRARGACACRSRQARRCARRSTAVR